MEACRAERSDGVVCCSVILVKARSLSLGKNEQEERRSERLNVEPVRSFALIARVARDSRRPKAFTTGLFRSMSFAQ